MAVSALSDLPPETRPPRGHGIFPPLFRYGGTILGAVLSLMAFSGHSRGADGDWLRDTFRAICRHESYDGRKLVGDGGRAIGPAHITPVMVAECRRLGGRFTLADRWSREKSWQMFRLHSLAHGARTPEQAARMWNKGANAIRRGLGHSYWAKIRRLM